MADHHIEVAMQLITAYNIQNVADHYIINGVDHKTLASKLVPKVTIHHNGALKIAI